MPEGIQPEEHDAHDAPPQPNQDHFFLDHLQSVQGAEWYYNQRYLGRGGNGTAFLVTCSSGTNYGMQFVLKVFHRISNEARRQAFLSEIQHLRTINHPAIIQIYDEGAFTTAAQNSYPFAVIEYLPRTARHLLLAKQIDRLRALRIALNCLSALKCLHSAAPQLIHRDIKPENILIGDMGAKLADFGLVKVLSENPEQQDLEAHDGTQWPGMPWRYRTPELVRRAVDHTVQITTASDIYQFGTVLYELLTGFNPQKAPQNITDPIELELRDIRGSQGNELVQIIGSMLNEAPADRPTAPQCLTRMNLIHRAYCHDLFQVTGQFV